MPLAMTFKFLSSTTSSPMREVTRLALQEMGVRQDHRRGKRRRRFQESDDAAAGHDHFRLQHAGDGRSWSAARRVRGHPAVRKLPFILVTGRGDNALVVSAAQAGVNNYIVKPFTAGECFARRSRRSSASFHEAAGPVPSLPVPRRRGARVRRAHLSVRAGRAPWRQREWGGGAEGAGWGCTVLQDPPHRYISPPRPANAGHPSWGGGRLPRSSAAQSSDPASTARVF